MGAGRRLLPKVLVAMLCIELFVPTLTADTARPAHADPA